MVENQNERLKAKGKGATAWPEAKSNPKRKVSGGPTGQVPKMDHSEKFCQRCKAHGSPYQTHNTLDCHRYDSNGSPLRQQQVSPLCPRSPRQNLRVIRALPLCRPCLRYMQRPIRKPVSLRSLRSAIMTPVTVPTVNRKLGTATWDLV
jgi:hypothetical protein